MNLSALLCANLCDISTWTTETVDRVLIEGDFMFLKAFKEGSIPDAETISLNYHARSSPLVYDGKEKIARRGKQSK